MATTVIHIRNAPKGWKENPAYVFIGRPSKWGNPYRPEQHGRRGCVNLFRQRLRAMPQLVEAAREELRDKILVCFCKPQACHGDVLAYVSDGGAP